MKSFELFTQGHSLADMLSASGFWQFVTSLFCLPANLIIEFISSNHTLSQIAKWSASPDDLFNSWSAACGAFVIWILIVALLAGTNKPTTQ